MFLLCISQNSPGQYWVMHYGVEIPSRVFVGRMPYDVSSSFHTTLILYKRDFSHINFQY